jgi:hypothetical protein
MDFVVCIQCFNKPIETMLVLESLEKNENLKNIHLLLYVDIANINNKSYNNNNELIKRLNNYKEEKNNIYKSITIKISDKNLGPYKCCFETINTGFSISDNVIFSEDDILFCNDTINYFISYFKNNIKNIDINDEKCIGITSSSLYFGYNQKNSFQINKNQIIPNDNLINKINDIKQDINNDNLLNICHKINWSPNKQFGLLKHNWEKILFFRTDEYLLNKELNTKAPDYATALFVKENNYYFIYSYIPRSNDIGLYNELGCTTLYYNDIPSPDTIKFITSDDFVISNNDYILSDNLLTNQNID